MSNELIPLMAAVAQGEANNGWDTVNVNSFGGRYTGTPISQLALDQVIAQQGHRYGAAGMFQGSKDTLKRFKQANKLTGQEKYDATLQKKFFNWLLRDSPYVMQFLDAASDEEALKHIDKAGHYMSSQWRGIQNSSGKGYSDGDKYGNMATVEYDLIKKGLMDYRRAYQSSKNKVKKPKIDYIMMPDGHKVQVPTDPAQQAELMAMLEQNAPSTKFDSAHSQQPATITNATRKPLTDEQRAKIEAGIAEEEKRMKQYMALAKEKQSEAEYAGNLNLGALIGKAMQLKGDAIQGAANALAGDNKTGQVATKAAGRVANTASYAAPVLGQLNMALDATAGLGVVV